MEVVVQDGASSRDDQRAGESVSSSGRPPSLLVDTAYEPACSGNAPGAATSGTICPGAVTSCGVPEETAYWVFTRTRSTVDGSVTPWVRRSVPSQVCLRADELVAPQPPVEVLIAGVLSREFASLPLPRGEVVVQPSGATLVNVPTRFSTPTGTTELAPRTILGRQVTVTAVAERFVWDFGDGASATRSSGERVEHVYRQAGERQASVRITWSGTFRVAGVPGSFAISGTASTDGLPVVVDVRTARAELVEG